MQTTDPRLSSALALVAAAVWLGGMLALGAIVAPVVFTMIPRPEAADAMTVVFSRFDRIAVGAVAVILASEAWRAQGRARVRRLDVARMAAAAIGAVLALAEALWITPEIVGLHQTGAIRGMGPAGLELDRMHSLAEACGKAQAAFALAVIVLHALTLEAPARRGKARPIPAEPSRAAPGA